MGKKSLSILGSTGSIGRQTLEVVASQAEAFRIVALAAGKNVELLAEQIRRFRPEVVAVADAEARKKLQEHLEGWSGPLLVGDEGLQEVATWPAADMVVAAVVGVAGLKATFAALQKGKSVALANKEALVAGGDLIMPLVRGEKSRLLPVDSEHSAIFQCLEGEKRQHLKKIILTASGGPFHGRRPEELVKVTAEAALAHPNWRMGPKITIDSATLMNKGLEVIEAHHLFGVDYQEIEVVIHRQSIIHSLVELRDGSVLAQLGWPDMRLPIQYALTYPERRPGPVAALDLLRASPLTFEPPNRATFPALDLAYAAGRMGGTMPAVLNAANEVAVGAFLAGRIGFLDIPRIVKETMERHSPLTPQVLDDILRIDAWARKEAESLIS